MSKQWHESPTTVSLHCAWWTKRNTMEPVGATAKDPARYLVLTAMALKERARMKKRGPQRSGPYLKYALKQTPPILYEGGGVSDPPVVGRTERWEGVVGFLALASQIWASTGMA